ncbi:MAG: carboxypeptidase M32 [Deinococcaceae bacterium]
MDTFNQLKRWAAQLKDLGYVSSLLAWDQDVYMPKLALEHRSSQMATLSVLEHQMGTDPKVRGWLEELHVLETEDTFEGALVRVVRRSYEKTCKIPEAFAEDSARTYSAAHHAWTEARAANDFKSFAPHLKKIWDLKRKYVERVGFSDHPYDALLDDFEPGVKAQDIRKIFNDLRSRLLPLLKAIQSRGDVADYSVLTRPFDIQKQDQFGWKIAKILGLHEDFARQDVAVHPFCTNLGRNDIRITTRFDEHYFPDSLFSTWHETGHGMYEHNIDPIYAGTPLSCGTSMGVHESQSRLFENIIGRSKAFWSRHFEEFKGLFPDALRNVSVDEFYRIINRVHASYIRVDADEVTYNFHVILRFELEMALIEETLSIDDLPETWNAKMQEYLGVTPPNDTLGVLQDVHWSFGLMGYFPTYTLGNLTSAQLYYAAQRQMGDVQPEFEKGNFAPLLEWMRLNVHQHGSRYLPNELILRATQKPLSADDYIQYLTEKYSEIYRL